MEKVIIGNATLYKGDSEIILPQLGTFDLLLTDPPYGLDMGNKRIGTPRKAPVSFDGDSSWDNQPPPIWMFLLMATKAKHQIIWGGNFFGLPASSGWLVWNKDNTGRFADCELAWTNLTQAVRMKKYRWNGMLQENMKQKEKRIHPTQKPVAVMEWCLGFVPDAVTVLDPYMGSGSIGVACHNTGKKYVGIEREPEYFENACKRIEKTQAQLKLFKPTLGNGTDMEEQGELF